MSVRSAASTPTATELLTIAAYRLRHASAVDAETFMKEVVGLLEERDALLSGTPVDVRAVIGLCACPLEAGLEVCLPQGTLRSATARERRYQPFLTEGEVRADAALETRVTGQFVSDDNDGTALQMEGHERLNAAAREVILSFALASKEPAPRSLPAVAWITELAPLARGTHAYRPFRSAGRVPGRDEPVSSDELDRVRHWASGVASADLTHVSIAVERLLRACWEIDPTESLIDAVITWENLVGTRLARILRLRPRIGFDIAVRVTFAQWVVVGGLPRAC